MKINLKIFSTLYFRTIAMSMMFPLFFVACGIPEKFPDLGFKVAGPIDAAVSDDGKYFYVLNSDFDRTYDQGTILVVDEDGKKVGAVNVPRMGRAVTVFAYVMVPPFDQAEDGTFQEVHLYDLSKKPDRPD